MDGSWYWALFALFSLYNFRLKRVNNGKIWLLVQFGVIRRLGQNVKKYGVLNEMLSYGQIT